MLKYFFLCLSFNASCISFSQKSDTSISQTWISSLNQFRFNTHWGSTAELQVRTKDDFTRGIGQASVRLGMACYFSDNVRLSAGHFFAGNLIRHHVWQAEHSPWLQLFWANPLKRLSMNQSIRVEDRFRRKVQNNKPVHGYNSNYRARYNLAFQYPLNKKPATKGVFDAVVYNELYINFGKQVVYNSFDQFRVYGGFNYHVSKASTLQCGYLSTFQQLASGNQYRKLHVARLLYLHNFDLRIKHLKTRLPADVSFHPKNLARRNEA